jgi:hypothetical protein
MFWVAFSEDTQTGLVSPNGDAESPRVGVTSRCYCRPVQGLFPEGIYPGDIFMQDGASVHTKYIVFQLLRELVMVWQPYSPDLNPIENLRALMEAEIYKLYTELEHADDPRQTLQALGEAVKELSMQLMRLYYITCL